MSNRHSIHTSSQSRQHNHVAVVLTLGLIALFTAVVLTFTAMSHYRQANETQMRDHLRAELSVHREAVRSYLDNVAGDLQRLTSAPGSGEMLVAFERAAQSLGEDSAEKRQRAYLYDNPNPPARRDALLRSTQGTAYDTVHARYHSWLRELVNQRDYYDLFLVSADGDILYTVRKENDFATSLRNGPFADTELGATFTYLSENSSVEKVAFRDFMPYAPSAYKPAAFVGRALMTNRRFAGALIVQLRARPLGILMDTARSLGDSGKAYLVGDDNLNRTASRTGEFQEPLKLTIDTVSVSRALAGISGVESIDDHRGVDVLSAHAPLVWNGTQWALIVEVDREMVDGPLQELQNKLLLGGALCVLIAVLLGWVLGAPVQSTYERAMKNQKEYKNHKVSGEKHTSSEGEGIQQQKMAKTKAQV